MATNSNFNPHRVTIVGAGRIGTIHLQCLLELSTSFQVSNIVDDHPSETTRFLVSRHSSIKLRPQSEVDDAIEDSDVVGVCVPTSLHEGVILKALNAGKHVFSEKPLVNTLEAVHRVYDTAKAKGLLLLCGMTRRFDPPAQKVKKEIEAGNLGTILNITGINRDNPYPPIEFLKHSPNIYYDCGVHDIDLALWLLGEKPVLVYCMGHCFDKRLQPYDDDDNASILMKFPSGATSIIELSRFSNCGFDQRFMVHGDQKSAGSYSLPKDGYLEMTNQQGVSKSCLRFDFQRRFERAYVEEWKHLHLCLVGTEEPMVKKEEVLSATLTADAINCSRETGLPVTIDHEKFTFHPKQSSK